MTAQASLSVRNSRLNAVEAEIGSSPILRIYEGILPENCAASVGTDTLLAEMTLPANWLEDASDGMVSKLGLWETTALETGTAGYFRIYDSGGTTCHMQGTVTQVGFQGEMLFEDTEFVATYPVVIATFVLVEGNN